MEAKTFDEVYASLMDEWTENPEQPIDEFLKKKLAEAGVSKEEQASYDTASKAIDRIEENMKEIEVATNNGFTPMEWLKSKLKKLVKSKSDDKKEQDMMMEIYDKSFSKIREKDEEESDIETQEQEAE